MTSGEGEKGDLVLRIGVSLEGVLQAGALAVAYYLLKWGGERDEEFPGEGDEKTVLITEEGMLTRLRCTRRRDGGWSQGRCHESSRFRGLTVRASSVEKAL